jgi:hypothetical protein
MVVVAITVAVTDVYLAGHNRPTLGRPWLVYPDLRVHLSRGDLLLLVAATMAGVWFTRATLARRLAQRGASTTKDR